MALFPPCNTTAAMMRKLLKKQGFTPEMRVTDKSRSHAAFKSEFETLRSPSARATQKQPNREFTSAGTTTRVQDARFKSPGSAQRFCPFIPPSTTPSTPAPPHIP